MLLCVDSDKVDAEIRYENCEGGSQLFPHVYGPINLDAVAEVVPFNPNAEGVFVLPEAVRRLNG